MELDGHPTQDIVEELQRRGAAVYPGTTSGPDTQSLELARKQLQEDGLWLFLPPTVYETEIDEPPAI